MPNAIYAALPTTIFTVMSGLARELGAVNLGQGFPDEPGPEAIRRAAAEAVLTGNNQYPPMPGLPELREAVARHYAGVLRSFIMDTVDEALAPEIRALGLRVLVTNTIMTSAADRARLAAEVLAFGMPA